MRYTETLEVLCLEMLGQFLVRELLGKGPVIELECEIFAAETILETALEATLIEHLLWTEIDQQLLDIVESTLGNKEFSC